MTPFAIHTAVRAHGRLNSIGGPFMFHYAEG
jgi:hypothetical protein